MATPRAGLLALCLLLTFLAAPPLHSGVVAFPESSGEGAARRAEQAAPTISSPSANGQGNQELKRLDPAHDAGVPYDEQDSLTSLSPVAMNADAGSEDRIEVETITVDARGFSPREITSRHGPFMLAISNHSGNSAINLRLDRVAGNRMHEVRLPKGRTKWSEVLNLPPGEYVLSEQNHPNWHCFIKLTPR